MTLETKKTIALIGSALAAIVVIAGNILMAIQIKIQGSGFYVSYLFYSLAILAGGMFITWLPKMTNHKWGFRKVDGRLKWARYDNIVDEKRRRLIFWPLVTVFFELFGIFSFCNDLWPSGKYETLMYIFLFITVALMLVWALTTAKKKEGQL